MRKTLTTSAFILSCLWAAVAQGDPTRYRFAFTGADLMNRVFVDGANGTSAAQNGLFDGARLLRVGTNASHADAGRTYIQTQHDEFATRWNTYAQNDYFLYNVGLWGWDGNGANWGEDYKPTQWLTHSGTGSASGWETSMTTWPWGTPPAGTITDQRPDWDANYDDDAGKYNGIYLNDPTSWESFKFSVDLLIDPADAWWGQDTHGAPNSLTEPELTIWFGGYIYGYVNNAWDYHLYEGNILLTGSKISVVPAPGAALLGFVGLGIVGWVKRRIG